MSFSGWSQSCDDVGHVTTFFLSQLFAKLWPIRETCLLSLWAQRNSWSTPFSRKKFFGVTLKKYVSATLKVKTFEGILFIFVWLKETSRYLKEKEHELIELSEIYFSTTSVRLFSALGSMQKLVSYSNDVWNKRIMHYTHSSIPQWLKIPP